MIPRSQLVSHAHAFAAAAHEAINHHRKYTNEPYIKHCQDVVSILINAIYEPSTEMLAIAWLHDVVEDTSVSISTVRRFFGRKVADGVADLTDLPAVRGGMNREARKRLDAQRIWAAPTEVQNVKLADIISNTRDILKHDPGFAKVYLPEKEYLLSNMNHDVNPLLLATALKQTTL